MYPDLKFMNANDDLIFAPLEGHSTINSGLFMPEEFIEEFRTSSISENPLSFDFRDTILSSNIPNKEEELEDLINFYENDPRITKDTLKSYNNFDADSLISNSLQIPLECHILRDLDLITDEDILELEKDFEDIYELEARYPNKCNSEIIFNKLIAKNPRIINVLKAYRVPFPVAKTLIKQIIDFSVNYCAGIPTTMPLPKPIPTYPIGGGIKPMYSFKNTTGDINDN